MEDPQKAALYAWENGWYDWCRRSITVREGRRLVRKVCRTYGVKPPAVRSHRHGEWSYYHPDEDVISFQHGQLNREVALHEAAHVVLFKLCKQEADEESDGNFEDHGPEFLGLLIHLLSEFGVAPLVALTASAKEAGLRFISVQAAQPTRLRRRVAKVLA